MSRWISRAPASQERSGAGRCGRARREDVVHQQDPRGGGRRGMRVKAPSIARNRSSRVRRDCGAVAVVRRTKAAAGRSSSRASARASTRAWSKPRSARRREASGTQVTASAGGGPSAARAAASASPTPRQPENFRRWTASRAGPRYANAERIERDRCRRAVATSIHVDGAMGGRSDGTTAAPGGRGRRHPSAERPRACAASGAGAREQDVDGPFERRLEHGGTLRRAADTAQGSGTSTGVGALDRDRQDAIGSSARDRRRRRPAPVSASKIVVQHGKTVPVGRRA